MSRQATRDTEPELALRRRLHAAGYRFRVDFAPLPGLRRRADVVFTRRKVAVFNAYREWVVAQPELMSSLEELRSKRLGCWCAPKACHGDVLIELLDRT